MIDGLVSLEKKYQSLKFCIWKNDEQLIHLIRSITLGNAVKQGRRQEGKQFQGLKISSLETGLGVFHLYIGITSCDYKIT